MRYSKKYAKVTDIQKFIIGTLVYRSRDAPALLSMRFHVHLCIRKANLILRFVFLRLCVFACDSSKNSDDLSLTFLIKLKLVFVCFMLSWWMIRTVYLYPAIGVVGLWMMMVMNSYLFTLQGDELFVAVKGFTVVLSYIRMILIDIHI